MGKKPNPENPVFPMIRADVDEVEVRGHKVVERLERSLNELKGLIARHKIYDLKERLNGIEYRIKVLEKEGRDQEVLVRLNAEAERLRNRIKELRDGDESDPLSSSDEVNSEQ